MWVSQRDSRGTAKKIAERGHSGEQNGGHYQWAALVWAVWSAVDSGVISH